MNAPQDTSQRFFRNIAVLIAFFAGLSALAALPWGWEWACRHNCPLDHPLWAWRKAHLHFMPVGTRGLMPGPQAFAGNRVNLHAWHGNQEIVLRYPVDPARLSFRARLDTSAYLVVFLNRTRSVPLPEDPPDRALRVSSNPSTPSAWLLVDPEGRFMERAPFTLPHPMDAGAWHCFTLEFSNDRVKLFQDGVAVSDIPRDWAGPRHIAFRGSDSRYYCAVDDARAEDAAGNVLFTETFDRRDLFGFAWGCCFLACFGVSAGLLLLVAQKPAFRTVVTALLLLGQVSLVLCGTVFWIMATRQRAYYPPAPLLIDREQAHVRKVLTERQDTMMQACDTVTEPLKVVFLGTSQTWGEGASAPGLEWARRSVSILNSYNVLPPLGTVNAAVPGAVSAQLADLYAELLTHCPHQVLCVNLGINDKDPEELERHLDRITREARDHDVAVILFSEAAQFSRDPAFNLKVRSIQRVAERYHLPYLNLDEAIGQADDGLRWWDSAHPTDWGHHLIADAVARFLKVHLPDPLKSAP